MSIFVIIGNYHRFKRTYLKLKTFELSLICLSPSSLQDVSGRASELLIGKKNLRPDPLAGALGFLANLSESISKQTSPSAISLVSPSCGQRLAENQASHCKRLDASAELITIACARFPALGVGNAGVDPGEGLPEGVATPL